MGIVRFVIKPYDPFQKADALSSKDRKAVVIYNQR